jgi:hypothetical protein
MIGVTVSLQPSTKGPLPVFWDWKYLTSYKQIDMFQFMVIFQNFLLLHSRLHHDKSSLAIIFSICSIILSLNATDSFCAESYVIQFAVKKFKD